MVEIVTATAAVAAMATAMVAVATNTAAVVAMVTAIVAMGTARAAVVAMATAMAATMAATISAVAGTKTTAATVMTGDTDNNQLKEAAVETTAGATVKVDDQGMQDWVVAYSGEGTMVARDAEDS